MVQVPMVNLAMVVQEVIQALATPIQSIRKVADLKNISRLAEATKALNTPLDLRHQDLQVVIHEVAVVVVIDVVHAQAAVAVAQGSKNNGIIRSIARS